MTEPAAPVTWATAPSPFGPLLMAATPVGLVRLALPGEDHDAVLASLAAHVGPLVHDPGALGGVAGEIEEYFAGIRREFSHPLDWRLTGGFRRTVLERMAEIPYGATRTYADLAAAAGNPGAVRAAGTACATNPLPIVIPCHRVVRSDGTTGRYGGGAAMKVALLTMEARAAGTGPRRVGEALVAAR